MSVNVIHGPTFQASVYVGCREGYDGPEFSKLRLLEAIQEFHEQFPNTKACLRIEACTYIAGKYIEDGWSINVIDYPRFPKDHNTITITMGMLADHLRRSLKQNRVGLVTPKTTFLYESESPEEHPKVNRS